MKALKKVENTSTMNFDSHGVTMWFLKRNQERVEGNSIGAEILALLESHGKASLLAIEPNFVWGRLFHDY